MKKFSFKSKSRHQSSKRQELEVNTLWVLGIAAAIFVVIYGILFLFKDSTLGVLFYERGFTQFVVVALSAIVIATAVLKYEKLRSEYRALNRIWIADHIPLEKPDAPEVAYFQDRLSKENNLVAIRCGRILKAYLQSGDRTAANEFALDDSSFYLSSSESSYSVPRILIWAIPLLGFIGTVVGISQAVNGFSGFLENSGDVEQIKEGIGVVTSGLAVAFDTTLLALFFSVLVMIPLVLVERYEYRLLLGIDVFINDKLLPRLREKNAQQLDVATINRAVKGAIDDHFPEPIDLIEPAQSYAEQASQALARGFLNEISKVQDVNSQLMAQITEVRQLASQDREKFITFFNQQQTASQELVYQIRSTVEEIRNRNVAIANDLNQQTSAISRQLEHAAQALEQRVAALEQAANKISHLQQLQEGLERSFASLEKTAQLEQVLVGVRENLSRLQPLLQQLNKPRRITLVEQDDNHNRPYN
ncbi:MAG: MotA/TolQ/ExbB proton channel family protein [Pleurocapsa sp.]